MRVCIVGASGKLGRYMVQHALDREYDVVGVCRQQRVEKLDAFKERITVIPGATNDPEVITRALAGCGGVVGVLGPRGAPGGSPSRPREAGTAARGERPKPCSTTRLRARASCFRVGGTSRATGRT